MHIACHCGHIDLALNLMKHGVRADDPVGYHPYRQWCNIEPHTESIKPPIHECGEQGQVSSTSFQFESSWKTDIFVQNKCLVTWVFLGEHRLCNRTP